MTGRPSDYTPELADRLCEQLAEGKSLRKVCQADDMPSLSTVFRWLRVHPEFQQQYVRAKEEAADLFADEIVEIADDASGDFIPGKDGPVLDSEHVQRSKLRIDARKWIASKLKPKKYGDKLEVDNKGELTVNVSVKRFTPEPPA